MKVWFVYGGLALCAFSLWALLRHDWLRLTRPRRRVIARVSGHRAQWEDGHRSHAAIYVFSDESGAHEVIDAVWTLHPEPDVGTMVELDYPDGRPDLARKPRPWTWLIVYAVLLYLTGILAAKSLGLLG